jgi:hypothetical protein
MDDTTYIGKTVVVGLTYVDPRGVITEQRQLHGVITKCEADAGIVIRLAGTADEFTLPWDRSSLHTAPAGTYFSHSKGEKIENPDLMTMWTFRQEQNGRYRAFPDPVDRKPKH